MAGIFDSLPSEKREEIIAVVKDIGAYKTSLKYASVIGMNQQNLYTKLKSLSENINGEKKTEKKITLTKEEKEFIERVGRGEVGLEEASRVIAKKAFEKILTDPKGVYITNWIKTEMLKIRKAEAENDANWAIELMNRMFLGQLPPKVCPHCGKDIISPEKIKAIEEHKVEEGEIIA